MKSLIFTRALLNLSNLLIPTSVFQFHRRLQTCLKYALCGNTINADRSILHDSVQLGDGLWPEVHPTHGQPGEARVLNQSRPHLAPGPRGKSVFSHACNRWAASFYIGNGELQF